MPYPQTTLTILTICLTIIIFGSCSKEAGTASEIEEYNSASNITLAYEKDQEFEQNLYQQLNNLLISIDQTPLTRSNQADNVAFNHTLQMIEANALHHDNFGDRQAYFISLGFQSVRENVAKGYNNPLDVIAAWLQSEDHRSAIESNSTHTGISVLKNESGIYFITQIYLK